MYSLLYGLCIFLSGPHTGWQQPYLALAALFVAALGLNNPQETLLKSCATGLLFGLVDGLTSGWWLITGFNRFFEPSVIMNLSVMAPAFLLRSLPFVLYAVFKYMLFRTKLAGPAILTAAFCLAMQTMQPVQFNPVYLPLIDYRLFAGLIRMDGWPFLLFFAAWLPFCAAWFIRLKDKQFIHYGIPVLVSLTVYTAALSGIWPENNKTVQKSAQTDELNVLVVQPAVSLEQARAYDQMITTQTDSQQAATVHDPYLKYFTLTRDWFEHHSGPGPDLVVWAESISAFSYYYNRPLFQKLQQKTQTPLLMNVSSRIKDGDAFIDYNTTALLDQTASPTAFYNKRYLLPFSAYIPLEEYLPWLRNIFRHSGQYRRGTAATTLPLTKEVSIIPAICYEAVVDGHIADFSQGRQNLLVVQANESYFSETRASLALLYHSRLYALQHHLPLVKAANMGISAAVNNEGSVQTSTRSVTLFNIQLNSQSSTDSHHRGLLYTLSLLMALGLAAAGRFLGHNKAA